MAERRVVDHDVLISDAMLIFEERFENTVGGARIDVVGADQRKAFDADFVNQILNRRNRLLIGGGTGIKDVFRGLLTFILHRVEQQAVKLFHYR